jgi:DNA mismatch endonuclease, patch repair protein
MDVLTKKQRAYNMSRIKGKNTKPELNLRKHLTKKGMRGYRIHMKIYGKPDIVFPKYHIAIFIDGCFWHKCKKCFTVPQTNKSFWMKKINANVQRDIIVSRKLRKEGYTVIRLPEHEIRNSLNSCYSIIYKKLTEKGFKNVIV